MLIGRRSIWELFDRWPFSEVLGFTLVFIPLWILPSTFSGLAAGAFCIQFGVQGAWGVVRLISKLESFADFWYISFLDSYPTRGDVTSGVPSYVPRCSIPTRQCLSANSVCRFTTTNFLYIDDIFSFSPDRSQYVSLLVISSTAILISPPSRRRTSAHDYHKGWSREECARLCNCTSRRSVHSVDETLNVA